jgi:hypothetical protein
MDLAILGLEWLRLILKVGPVALSTRTGGAQAAFDVGKATSQNEQAADQA